MLKIVHQYLLVTIVVAMLHTRASGTCPSCSGPLPQLHEIIEGQEAIEYYHESSTTLSWCANGQLIRSDNFPQLTPMPNEKKLVYNNISLSDEDVSLYLIDESEGIHCINVDSVAHTIRSTEGNINSKLVLIHVVKAIPCSEPPSPCNGSVVMDGQTAVFSCDPGFYLNGNETIRCERASGEIQGHWNDSFPTCHSIICEKQAIVNGEVEYCNGGSSMEGVTYDTVATYKCNDGYTLKGTRTQTCGSGFNGTGNWNGTLPHCEPNRCEELEDPNGNITFSHPLTDTTLPVGTEATITCASGYRVSTNESRECMPNGNWSLPQVTCIPNKCKKLEDPNGNITFSHPLNKTVIDTTLPVGTIATITCASGYRVSSNESRECMPNGNWSEPQVTCIQITCFPLETPPNGSVTYSEESRVVGSSVTYTCDEDYSYGTVATYSCRDGFTLTGDATQTCGSGFNSTGSWNGTLPPHCKPNKCKKLKDPPNGNITFWHPLNETVTDTTLPVGTIATITCASGYRVSSNESRERMPNGLCTPNGNWRVPQVTCIQKTCFSLEAPTNGNLTYSDESRAVGSNVTYTCDDGYYVVRGDEIRVCNVGKDGKTGEWTGEPPACAPIVPSPLPLNNTYFALSASGGLLVGLIVGSLTTVFLSYIFCGRRKQGDTISGTGYPNLTAQGNAESNNHELSDSMKVADSDTYRESPPF